MAWQPQGTLLATTDDHQLLRIWDAGTWEVLRELRRGPLGQPCETRPDVLTWSPDGARLAAGGCDGAVWVWDAGSGEEVFPFPRRGHGATVSSVSWSPNGRRLATGSLDQTVRV